MRLVWSNAKKFNEPGSDIYKSAERLRRDWARIFRKVKQDPAVVKIWAKKARRSKPKRSPRSNLAKKSIGKKRKRIRKNPTGAIATSKYISQLSKEQKCNSFSSSKSLTHIGLV